ncbi:high affinity choline transporter 1-like [Amblyomma americanum]
MLDPFQEHYGRWMGLLLCLPAVCGEIFWTAAMLAALGATAAAITEVDPGLFIVLSATAIFFYTALGGFYSVSYTDVFQIGSTAACLWICVPYVSSSPAVGAVGPPHNDWIGTIAVKDVAQLLDAFLMTALGGIPWQVYFQRVLSCESHFAAKMVSFVAATGCVFMAIPPVIIGATAKSANFTAAGYRGPWMLRERDSYSVLPYAVRYLMPASASVVGMVGITAAVMSSADSSMLSASTMVTRNIYLVLLRPTASDTEVAVMLRFMVCLIGAFATYLALSVQSVYELWILCSDVVYILLFPQLVCVFYLKGTNTYGSIMAFFLGAFSRWLCGQPSVNMPATPWMPIYDPPRGQMVPFRFACMALGVSSLVLGSLLTAMAFKRHWIPPHYDVFGCFVGRQAAHESTMQSTGGIVTAGHEQPRKSISDGGPAAQKHTRQSVGGVPADQQNPRHIVGGGGPVDHQNARHIVGGGGLVDHQNARHIIGGGGPADRRDARHIVGGGGPTDRQNTRHIVSGGGPVDHQNARHIVGGGGPSDHQNTRHIVGGGGPADREHTGHSVDSPHVSRQPSDASEPVVELLDAEMQPASRRRKSSGGADRRADAQRVARKADTRRKSAAGVASRDTTRSSRGAKDKASAQGRHLDRARQHM